MRKIFIALGCYFTLSTFSGFSASQMSGHRLTEELRMLSRKSGKIISFSQTLTDQCYTDNKAEFSVRQARDFEKNLSDLLDGTFFEYKKVNDRMFLVYKIREVVTEPDEPVFVIPAIRQDYAVGSVTVVPVLMPQTSCPIDEIYFAPSVYDDMGLPKSRDRFALKTNLLYYAIPSVNLAFEFAISSKMTIDFAAYYNWGTSDKRLVDHIIVQPELRYYFKQRMKGSFIGLNMLGGIVKLGGIKGAEEKYETNIYEANILAAGLVYGYNIHINKALSIEPVLGLGAVYSDFTRYGFADKKKEKKYSNQKIFPFVTKVAVNFIYRL